MEILFYLIRTVLMMLLFALNISKIENKAIRRVCLLLGVPLLFGAGIIWVLAIL